MPMTNAQRAVAANRRNRRRAAKKMYRKKRSTKYADVHSFKLVGAETKWFSSYDGTGTAVQYSGPNVAIGNISLSGSGLNQVARFGGVVLPKASNTTQWSQLNTLFDRYKIHGVKYTFIPEFNVAQTVQSGLLPTIKFAHDYDDNTVPTVGDVWARQGKVMRFTRPISIYVRPRILGSTIQDSGAGTLAYGITQKAPYLNCAFGNIPHFGLKFAVKDWAAPTGTTVQMVCRVETVYYVTLRNQINTGALGHEGDEAGVEPPNDGEQEDVACELKPPA